MILSVALAYIELRNVPEFYRFRACPDRRRFPICLGLVFAACGAWLLISPKDILAAWSKPAEAVAALAGPSLMSRITAHWHLVAMWAVVLAYLWFMPDIGFPVATSCSCSPSSTCSARRAGASCSPCR